MSMTSWQTSGMILPTEPEPENILDTSTVALNELYESYVRAGFTEEHAMQLIEVHLIDILRKADDVQ